MSEQQSASTPSQPLSPQVTAEQTAFANIKVGFNIQSYEVLSSDGQVTGAVIQLPSYSIVLKCTGGAYPKHGPQAEVHFQDGSIFQPSVQWFSGINTLLAQVVPTIIAQVSSRDKKPPRPDKSERRYKIDDDED